MMKKSATLIMATLLLAVLLLSAAQTARAASVWTPGLYTGWVYFMAKTDFEFNMDSGDVSIHGGGVRFWESHGNVECSVFDENGNGTCSASFPMDIVMGESVTFVMPDCSGTVIENSRANALNSLAPLAGLSATPLEQGFSVAFNPQVGPENGSMTVTGCQSLSQSFTVTPGQPQWPALDFGVGYHTALGMGGTCSMKGLPRLANAGMISSTLSLDQCEWRVLFTDPYATLSQE